MTAKEREMSVQIAEAETASEFAEKIEAAPIREDWTEQLWPASQRQRYVSIQLSELERDRLLSILRAPR
jgi:hypothetical protein